MFRALTTVTPTGVEHRLYVRLFSPLPRHAAFPEIIEATGGGVLCEPGDAKSLADAVEQLLADPARARELGRRGREAVEQYFSIARMSENMMREFEALRAARFSNRKS